MATPIHRIGPSPNGSEAHSRLEFGVSKGGQRVTCSVCFSRRAAATARQRTDCPVCHVAAAHRMLLVVQLVHGSRGIFPRAKSIPCRQAARVNSAAGAYLCDCNCARGWGWGCDDDPRIRAEAWNVSRIGVAVPMEMESSPDCKSRRGHARTVLGTCEPHPLCWFRPHRLRQPRCHGPRKVLDGTERLCA